MHDRLPGPLRFLYRWAYYGADLAVSLSEFSPPDGTRLRARRECIIPNAVEDRAGPDVLARRRPGEPPRILFAGTLREEKGLLVLLEAAAILRRRGVALRVEAIGAFESRAFHEEMLRRIVMLELADVVQLPGQLLDVDKDAAFLRADVFCLPSHYYGEGVPLVLIEAAQFGLPLVATRWRGIPSVVREGVTGYLVPPRDPAALADRLERLLDNPVLRANIGAHARELYLAEYTLKRYREAIEHAICNVAGDFQ